MHHLISFLPVIKQRKDKQGFFCLGVFRLCQGIQQGTLAHSIFLQMIQSTAQVHIPISDSPDFLEKATTLTAHKHLVCVECACNGKCQCQCTDNTDICAQLFLKPLQHLSRIAQAILLKIDRDIHILLPNLGSFNLAIVHPCLVVLRSLYHQFGKSMIQCQINGFLIGRVCRHDFLIHSCPSFRDYLGQWPPVE